MVKGTEDIIPIEFLFTPFSSPYNTIFKVRAVVFKSFATVYGSIFPVVASPFKRLAQYVIFKGILFKVKGEK